MKSVFDLAENLSLVLTKLDTELGLAQPQLVYICLNSIGVQSTAHPSQPERTKKDKLLVKL